MLFNEVSNLDNSVVRMSIVDQDLAYELGSISKRSSETVNGEIFEY